jgi:hypothetical protein
VPAADERACTGTEDGSNDLAVGRVMRGCIAYGDQI